MNTFQRVAAVANAAVRPLFSLPVLGSLISKSLTEITYVGRKSGRTFTAPVGYKRRGNKVTIGVALPDQKNWWRNFYPDGGDIALTLDGVQRHGHAVAHRSDKGVHVTVELQPA